MASIPQLKMRMHMEARIPLPELPQGVCVHTYGEGDDKKWEWIVTSSFRTKVSFDMMKNDPAFRPERIFFVKEHAVDIATASAYFLPQHPNEGHLHMVACHDWCVGLRGGRIATISACNYFFDHGFKDILLTTDDFRLPAIHEYLELGFRPAFEEPTAEGRWKAVMENLEKYKKPVISPIEVIPGTGVTMKPFPVENAKWAMVVCPGGAYRHLASHEGDPICRMLNTTGIAAYRLDYRLYPNTPMDALEDAKRAIRVLRHMGYEKVGILGFSAGGHVTCMAATHYDLGNPDAVDPIERESSRPDAFVPCYAVQNVRIFPNAQWLCPVLEGEDREKLLHFFSAEENITPDTPPAFIWHTYEDEAVPVEQSFRLARTLKENNVPLALHIFGKGKHGLGLAGGMEPDAWAPMVQQWLTNTFSR